MRLHLLPTVVLCLILLGSAGCRQRPASPSSPTAADNGALQMRIADLEQQVTTLSRSDAISRQANRQLQGTLAERDEQIAALRADLDFYERFLGESGPPRGLSVHALQVRPQDPQVWHFIATLSQTANRDGDNRGRLSVALEGSQDGKLRKLAWTELRQDPKATGIDYKFRYLQRVEGDLILPPHFKPVRASVRLLPVGGKPVEQSFPWDQAAHG